MPKGHGFGGILTRISCVRSSQRQRCHRQKPDRRDREDASASAAVSHYCAGRVTADRRSDETMDPHARGGGTATRTGGDDDVMSAACVSIGDGHSKKLEKPRKRRTATTLTPKSIIHR